MKSTDRFLLEHAYYQVLTEQQRLIEEGKIWDFIKGMGNKLKNAWDVINAKIATNPKLYKTLMVAGPILASLAAKNFDNLSVSSETVKDLLNTLNGLDPNITAEDLTNVLSDWDHNHMAELGKVTDHADGGHTVSSLTLGKGEDGTYSYSGDTLHTVGTKGTDLEIASFVQTESQSLQEIATNTDLKSQLKDCIFSVVKSTNMDGSGGASLVSYSGTVTASSPEEAMKIVSELIKAAMQKSNIDTQNLTFTPEATLASAAESLYRINPNVYLVEFEAFNKLKNVVKGTANKVVSGIKNLVFGAADIVKKVKASFKKQPGTPEQIYKYVLKVGKKVPAQQPQQQVPAQQPQQQQVPARA